MRQAVPEIVIRDCRVSSDDRRFERRRCVCVRHVHDQCVVQEREESVAGFLSVHQRHPSAGNITVGVLDRGELIVDACKVAPQGAR